jgi:hypothetical protein
MKINNKEVFVKDISEQKFGIFTFEEEKFEYKSENKSRGEFFEKEIHVVNHWTVGRRSQLWDGYHCNITEMNNKLFCFRTLKRKEKGQHLWRRNSGAVGNALCSMYKEEKPTSEMVELLALLNAEQCAWYNLNPESFIDLPKKKISGEQLIDVEGEIIAPILGDHKFFGIKDSYGNQDIDFYMPLVKTKAIKYFKDLKSKNRKFELLEIIK